MNREEVLQYVKNKYHTNPEYLWLKYPQYAVLRDNKKWYGIVMNVSKRKLGFNDDEEIDMLNVKCPPVINGNIRMNNGILPAYHMNKEHWLSIMLDGSVLKEEVQQLIDLSFDTIKN